MSNSVVEAIDVIATGILTSSNIPANDHDLYSASATYSIDGLVTHGNKNYRAVIDGLIGVEPGTDATKWQDIGYINRYAAFDQKVGSQTENAGLIEFQIVPTQVYTALGLLNLAAESVTVVIDDPVDGVVYNKTISLVDTEVDDFHPYAFEPYGLNDSLVLTDLPTYIGATITIQINAAYTAKVGVAVLGYNHVLGNSEWGLSSGINDYSKKDTDEFGATSVVEGAYSDEASETIVFPTSRASRIKNLLTRLRAKPALWIGSENHQVSWVYGFCSRFNVVLEGNIESRVVIEKEGLI